MAKKKVELEKQEIDIDINLSYNIKSTGKSENMPKDEVYNVGGLVAKILVENGHAVIID